MEKSPKLEQHPPEPLFPASEGRKAVPKLPSKIGTALEQPSDLWIHEIPELWDLCRTLYCLALDYRFSWAKHWPDHWSDWKWTKVAMNQVYRRLNPEDRAVIQEAYEEFEQNVEHYDEIALNHSVI